MARVLLLVPSATYRASAFLDAARRLDLEVVTASDVDPALAGPGERFLRLPLDQPEEAARRVVAFADTSPLDAVVAVDDQGGLTAALASEALGLRHARAGAVRATRDKVALHRLLGRAEVPQARFETVEVDLDAWAAVPAGARGADALPAPVRRALSSAAGRLGYPVVVKPATLSGSRGVIRADDEAGLLSCAARVASITGAAGETGRHQLLVEAYLPGDEVALEGIVRAGRLQVLAVFDKPDPLEGPYFEETIYVTPSRHAPSVQRELARVVEAALAALDLDEGPVHAEARVGPTGRLAVLEVAARTIGGRCSSAFPLAGGTSLEEVVLARAAGIEKAAASRRRARLGPATGVMMLPIPATGRLEAVEGTETALAVEHVTGLELTVPIGRHVEALPEGDRYLGFLFARAERPEAVEAALRAAHAALHVRIAS